MDEILYEILEEVKGLAVKHAEIKGLLDAHIQKDIKQDAEIADLKDSVKSVREHGIIIKGMLWVYGIIVSLIVSREISKYFS